MMNNTQIIKIGGKPYWAGLDWEVIAQSENPKGRLRDLRKEEGKYGIYLMRKQSSSGVVSLGYAEISKTAYRKAPSLAAIVAHSKREPWMGIYQISENLWWYVAVREGQSVIPGGDVVGDRKTVLAARNEHQGIGEWRHSIEGGFAELLDVIQDGRSQVSGADAPVLLMRVRIQRKWVLLALVLLTIIGALTYRHHVHLMEQRALQAKLRAEKIALMHHKLAAERALMQKRRPWGGVPRVATLAHKCLIEEMNLLPIEKLGWEPKVLECLSNGSVKILWRRTPSGLSLFAPPGRMAENGDQVVQLVKSPKFADAQSKAQVWRTNIKLLSQSVLMRKLYGISQYVGVGLKIKSPQKRRMLPGEKQKKAGAGQAKAYHELLVTLRSKLGPKATTEALDWFGTIPSMTVGQIMVFNLGGHPRMKANLRVWVKQ